MRERDERLAVQPHQLGLALGVDLREAAVGAEAGVVHENVDLEPERGHLAGERGGIVCDVARHDVTATLQPGCELPQPILAAGDEDDLVPAR